MSYIDVDFFDRDTLAVAKDLIGTVLVVGRCEGRIVETEAYTDDAASHAVTRRHQASWMRETFGHVYIFFIYGMHYCLNFTTQQGEPGAVLIRAIEPTRGIKRMIQRRGLADERNLTNGPGKLCQAFGIDLSFNGQPLGRKLKLRPRDGEVAITTSRRIGISQAKELEWRYFETDNPFVSRG